MFKNDIQATAAEVNRLHRAVHDTHQRYWRDRSNERARCDWEIAAERFRSYVWPRHDRRNPASPVLDRMWRAGERVSGLLDDDELRRFAFEFLTVDPFFFESGYAKENMLRRIRKPVLTEAEKTAIRELILKWIDGPGMREFRDVCCMIPRAGNADLKERITSLTRSADPSVRARAAFAERYFQHDPY